MITRNTVCNAKPDVIGAADPTRDTIHWKRSSLSSANTKVPVVYESVVPPVPVETFA